MAVAICVGKDIPSALCVAAMADSARIIDHSADACRLTRARRFSLYRILSPTPLTPPKMLSGHLPGNGKVQRLQINSPGAFAVVERQHRAKLSCKALHRVIVRMGAHVEESQPA